jgi:hypothetical protein
MILAIDADTIKKAATFLASIGVIFLVKYAYRRHEVTELRRRTTRGQHKESAIIKNGYETRDNVCRDAISDMAWACARDCEGDGNQKLQNRDRDFSDASTTSSESEDSSTARLELSSSFTQDTDSCAKDTPRQCIIKKLQRTQDTAQIEFFLPQLNAWCQCKDCTRAMVVHHDKYAVQNLCCLLRPWQVAFLAKQNIYTAGDLLQLKSRDAMQLCKSMVSWRKENGMDGRRKKACQVALHIWIRACALLKAEVARLGRGRFVGGRSRLFFVELSHNSSSS